jgi:DNA-binding transcriptional LysR family regulator
MDDALQHWDSRIGRRLKLRDLQILAAVVQWGSMAKAASHLAMTQPAVSESIANLERALHVRLLDRSTHGVEPTIYAHALLKRGHVVFDELNQGIRDIEFLANPRAGEISIGSGETFDAGLLPAAIEQLSSRYPEVVVRVLQANTSSDFRELRERRVDLMLARVPASFVSDDIAVEVLFEDPNRIVVGARSRWARRRKITLAELADEPWIFSPNEAISALMNAAFKANGLEVPRSRISAASVLLRNHLLATGRFVTALPESVLRYNAEHWSLKALPIDLGVKARSVAVLTLKNRTVSPVVQLFVDHLRDVAKAMFRSASSRPTVRRPG